MRYLKGYGLRPFADLLFGGFDNISHPLSPEILVRPIHWSRLRLPRVISFLPVNTPDGRQARLDRSRPSRNVSAVGPRWAAYCGRLRSASGAALPSSSGVAARSMPAIEP